MKIKFEHLESINNEEIFDKDDLKICEQEVSEKEYTNKEASSMLEINDIL